MTESHRYDFPGIERVPLILRATADRMDQELPRDQVILDFRIGITYPPGTGTLTTEDQGGTCFVTFRTRPMNSVKVG